MKLTHLTLVAVVALAAQPALAGNEPGEAGKKTEKETRPVMEIVSESPETDDGESENEMPADWPQGVKPPETGEPDGFLEIKPEKQ